MSDASLVYRRLTPEEFSRPDLLAIHKTTATPQPPSSHASCWGAFDASGRIVGFLYFTLVFHLEPAGALPTSGFSLSSAVQAAEADITAMMLAPGEALTYYVNVQPSEAALAAARKNGITPVPGVIPHSKTIRRPE